MNTKPSSIRKLAVAAVLLALLTVSFTPLFSSSAGMVALIPAKAPDNESDLELEGSGSPDPVPAGGTLSYHFVITNKGPKGTENVVLVQTLPVAASFILPDPPGDYPCQASGSVVTCTLLDLGPAKSAIVTIQAVVASGATGNLVSTASVTSDKIDPNLANNGATITTSVSQSADLRITKTGSAGSLYPGASLSYTIQVTNDGPSDAYNVEVTDALPSQLTLVGTSPSQVSCSGGSPIVCTIGTIPTGATATFTLSTTINASSSPGIITNTASVSSSTADPAPDNNADSAQTTINPFAADLRIVKTASQANATAGGNLIYTLVVTNLGPHTAQAVVVNDVLPAELSLTSAVPSQGTCSGTSTLTCSLGNLAADTSTQITIQTQVSSNAIGSISNTATVSMSTAVVDPLESNNSATAVTPVIRPADLQVALTDIPDPVHSGALLTYLLTVNNAGPFQADNVRLTLNLPAQVGFLDLSGCSHVSGVVTCSLGTLALNQSVDTSIVVQVNPTFTGQLEASASVSSDTADPMPGNNLNGETTQVIEPPVVIIDEEDPVLQWVLPVGTGGRYIVGNDPVVLEVSATDNIGVVMVQIARWVPALGTYVNIALLTQPPYMVEIDPRDLHGGDNQITARAYDNAVNFTDQVIWLYKEVTYYGFLPVISINTGTPLAVGPGN